MFQTSINHFFQGFEGSFSNWFMNFMSNFGTYPVYLILIFILMFGWSLRKGFFIMHIMIWVGMANNYLKDYFNLPRPIDIDATLNVPGPDYNHIDLDSSNHSASGFLKTLPQEIVDKCRSLGIKSPGFPSGHSASAAAFWTAVPLLTKRIWIWITGILIIFLIMISRMYLGAHFLADVAGGFLLGIIIVIPAFILYVGILETHFRGKSSFHLFTLAGRILRFIYYIGFPIALSFVPQIGIQFTAPLMGINLAIITSSLGNIEERGQVWERVIRVFFAIALFYGSTKLLTVLPAPKTEILKFAEIALEYLIIIRLTIALCVWTRLYRRTY